MVHQPSSKRFFLLISLLEIFIALLPNNVYSDENRDLDQQLRETQQRLENAQNTKSATQQEIERLEQLKTQYEGTLNNLQNNYQVTQNQLALTMQQIREKEQELNTVHQELSETKERLDQRIKHLQKTVRALYIAATPNWITSLFVRTTASRLTQTFIYRGAVIADSNQQAKNLSSEVSKIAEIQSLLEQIKTELENQKESLNQQQLQLQNQIGNTRQQINAAESQLVNLQQALVGIDQEISSLTQKQKDILAAKAAAALASTSVGNVEINPATIEQDPPRDGQVYFSFWTYGYPHRVGMNQYGALGRAQAGQTAEQILKAYYSGVEIEQWDGPDQITITENGNNRTISFEDDYLLGIGEMPSCWGKPDRGGLEALKAQAIAARTYALAYTNNGANPICTTQSCQVYVGASKVAGECGSYWQQAVEETRGLVITSGGNLITAWYSSTAGGFTLSSAVVWGSSRPYAQGIADLDESGNAYDGPAHGNSPWYHKAWGNQPWLSIDQVTDLINAALLPETYNNQLAPANKGGLSPEQIISELQANGINPVVNLTAIEIVDENGNPGANTAQTAFVRAYYGDGSVAEVAGIRFKFVYNIRSPGTNAIWTSRFDAVTAAEL